MLLTSLASNPLVRKIAVAAGVSVVAVVAYAYYKKRSGTSQKPQKPQEPEKPFVGLEIEDEPIIPPCANSRAIAFACSEAIYEEETAVPLPVEIVSTYVPRELLYCENIESASQERAIPQGVAYIEESMEDIEICFDFACEDIIKCSQERSIPQGVDYFEEPVENIEICFNYYGFKLERVSIRDYYYIFNYSLFERFMIQKPILAIKNNDFDGIPQIVAIPQIKIIYEPIFEGADDLVDEYDADYDSDYDSECDFSDADSETAEILRAEEQSLKDLYDYNDIPYETINGRTVKIELNVIYEHDPRFDYYSIPDYNLFEIFMNLKPILAIEQQKEEKKLILVTLPPYVKKAPKKKAPAPKNQSYLLSEEFLTKEQKKINKNVMRGKIILDDDCPMGTLKDIKNHITVDMNLEKPIMQETVISTTEFKPVAKPIIKLEMVEQPIIKKSVTFKIESDSEEESSSEEEKEEEKEEEEESSSEEELEEEKEEESSSEEELEGSSSEDEEDEEEERRRRAEEEEAEREEAEDEEESEEDLGSEIDSESDSESESEEESKSDSNGPITKIIIEPELIENFKLRVAEEKKKIEESKAEEPIPETPTPEETKTAEETKLQKLYLKKRNEPIKNLCAYLKDVVIYENETYGPAFQGEDGKIYRHSASGNAFQIPDVHYRQWTNKKALNDSFKFMYQGKVRNAVNANIKYSFEEYLNFCKGVEEKRKIVQQKRAEKQAEKPAELCEDEKKEMMERYITYRPKTKDGRDWNRGWHPETDLKINNEFYSPLMVDQDPVSEEILYFRINLKNERLLLTPKEVETLQVNYYLSKAYGDRHDHNLVNEELISAFKARRTVARKFVPKPRTAKPTTAPILSKFRNQNSRKLDEVRNFKESIGK